MIKLSDISLKFDKRQILNCFNLTVNDGKKAVIRGISGMGKSSILAMIQGYIRPESGKIKIDNIELNNNNIRKIRSLIAWLPQEPGIIGDGTVIETILKPFSYSVNKNFKPSESQIIDFIGILGIDSSILTNNFNELSGGEKQRIGMVICKLLNRNIYLLDEPTSALDKESRRKAIDFFLEETSSTILSISHDDEWIKAFDIVIDIH